MHLGSPMAAMRSSILVYLSDLSAKRSRKARIMRWYSKESVVAYALIRSGLLAASSPYKSAIIRRVMSSIYDFEVVKFVNGQPYMIGGQAIRICTSLAPASNRQRVLSRSCVPRTMESSQKRILLPRRIA